MINIYVYFIILIIINIYIIYYIYFKLLNFEFSIIISELIQFDTIGKELFNTVFLNSQLSKWISLFLPLKILSFSYEKIIKY